MVKYSISTVVFKDIIFLWKFQFILASHATCVFKFFMKFFSSCGKQLVGYVNGML